MAVLLFVCVFVGGHRGVFVVVWGSQASPMPSWSVSVWSWLAMWGSYLEHRARRHRLG
ncbi:hypothetical protein HMPREF9587_02306 [Cutibacterium acnes HL025PA1]|nr:hypothetical protein HMPREF9587_02306 [Cutibacterium acnes HL025PA1]